MNARFGCSLICHGPRLWLLLFVALLLATAGASAQERQFSFDPNGNVETQTPASLAVPQILAHPQTQVVEPGELASFFIVAADTRGLSYQWRTNGVNLPGATSDALLLTNVSALNEGLYSVVLSNSSGSVTSAPAMLWIDSDGDGLADSWEQSYFGGLAQNPGGDFDGDGVSNSDEFLDGTSPTNSASAQFRLTLMSDGGQVAATPTKLSYTNGEPVTVTVTAFPGEIFHIWSGDVVTRTNPVTLVMTNNKTLFAHFGPIPFTWTNTASGDWHNPTNWSYHLVPTALDNAVLPNNVTVTADAPADCHGLTLTAGTLAGTSNITLHGDSVWTGGTMAGSGRTIIAPGATFTISSPTFTLTLARALENGGTVVWAGNPGLNLNNVVITNRAGALFHVQTAPTFSSAGGTPRFDNAGTFRKSANSGTTTFNIPFNNYGDLDLQIGTLHHSGSFLNNGSVAVAAGATQRMAGGGSGSGTFTNPPTGLVEWTGNNTFTLNPGAQLNGAGQYRINNTLTCNADSAVQLLDLNGTLNGTGVVTISNAMTWIGGTMAGTGRTIIAPGASLTISSAGFTLALERSLENGGTVVWTGNPGLNLANGVITNRAGALFHVQNATTLGAGVGAPRFDNAGTFRKSANSGTTTFNIPFNNYGDLDLQTGTLHQSGSFLNNGSVAVAAGATQRMAGGGSASGTFTNPATALVEWTANTFTLNTGAQLNSAGPYRISGGTVNFDTDVAVQNLELNATFGGSGAVTVSNTMSWTGGTMGGSGRTIIAPGATLTINNPFFTINLNRTMENGGTVLWTGAAVYVSNVAITNRAGALFHVQSAPSFLNNGGAPRFDNAGTFRKSVNSGTATINIPFNNYSTVDVQTGTLLNNSSFLNNGSVTLAPATTHRMTAGGSSSGTFTNSPTGLVEWTANTFTLNSGAQLNGAGLYQINGGTLNCNADVAMQNLDLPSGTLDGSGVVTISNAMTWTGGSLSGSGRTIMAPGATMTINNPFFTINLNRTMENGGTVLWTGAAVYVNNVAITNRVGALFHVQSAPTFYNNGGAPRFDNAGIFRKSANGGTTTFSIPFNNYGTTDIRSGFLAVNGGFTASSNALLNCVLGGTVAGTGYGQLQKSGTIVLDGSLSVELTNGFFPAVGNAFTIVSATTRSGAFSGFTYPTNLVTMQLSNTASSVIALVTAYSTNGPPAFGTNLPASQVFYAGRTAVQSVFAVGTGPLTYQWTKNGTNLLDSDRINGAQSSVLLISNAAFADAASYQVAVTNVEGGLLSTSSVVTVQAVPKLNAGGAGWSLQGTTPPVMNSNSVTLTSGLGSTGRNVFYNAPLYLPSFSASFIYRDVGGGGADGITFCLQNDSRGAATLGGGGGGLGYAGITPSLALAMNIYSPNTVGISLRTNGTLPVAYTPTPPVNIASGNPIHVSLLYTGAVLKVTLAESNTANTFTTNFPVNIPAVVGAETAYVGFTGGDGGVGSTQVVSNYTYVPLTPLALEQPVAGSFTLSWPVTIGGYSLQSKTNLANVLELWQNVTNSPLQSSNLNRVTITPQPVSQNYRLQINLNE